MTAIDAADLIVVDLLLVSAAGGSEALAGTVAASLVDAGWTWGPIRDDEVSALEHRRLGRELDRALSAAGLRAPYGANRREAARRLIGQGLTPPPTTNEES